MSGLASELSGYSVVPEPELRFAGQGLGKHPLMGLIQHGPYGLRYGSPNALRLALLAPARDLGKLRGLVAEFERPAKPKEATNYYPEYPGFSALFRIPIAREDDRLVIPVPDALDDYARDGNKQLLS